MAISDYDSEGYSSQFSSTSSIAPAKLPPPILPRTLANWWLNETLGSGYSGSIYRATNIHTHQVVALKVQDVNHECPTNRYERSFYPMLQGGLGMPRLWAAGVQGQWDYLAIDLLGASLDSLFKKSGKDCMELGGVCAIAMQLLSRLEFMHMRGVLHRDIQLGNCVVGLPPHDKTIYMIDFGFSKCYIDPSTGRHIPDSKTQRDFIGNYWFSSVNVHCRGAVPSRRDDIEATALMLIHLMTPRGLSWTRNGIPKSDDAHDRLKMEKRRARPATLCRGLPPVFEAFLTYSRTLKFKDCPDYGRWIDEFRSLAVAGGYGDSDAFVWPALPTNVRAVKTPQARKVGVVDKEVEEMIRGLGTLDLAKTQVLADRTNVQKAVQKARENARKASVTLVNSGPENEGMSKKPLQKQECLNKLAKDVGLAHSNVKLAALVLQFIDALQINQSRTLTKEGFYVLDKLHMQLAGPSTSVEPLRTSRTRSENSAASDVALTSSVITRLKVQVTSAESSAALADMIERFGRVTNQTSGRRITKDGFTFLRGLAQRLETME